MNIYIPSLKKGKLRLLRHDLGFCLVIASFLRLFAFIVFV